MQPLPNTEVRNCEHESHGDEPARAVTQIRFAVAGEVKEFWGCLEHRHATDFGYVPPKSDVEQLASAAPAETPKATAENDRSREISDGDDSESGAELNEPLPPSEYGDDAEEDAQNAEEEAR